MCLGELGRRPVCSDMLPLFSVSVSESRAAMLILFANHVPGKDRYNYNYTIHAS